MRIYRRILKIDQIIAAGTYPSTNDIIEKLKNDGEDEFSVSTIKRDIERMIEDLNAPIEYSKKNEGWYYTTKTFRLPVIFASEKEMFAAELSSMVIDKALDETGASDDAKSILNDITENVVENELNWIKNRILILGDNSCKVCKEIWNTILESVKQNREISFEYKGTWDEDYKKRHVRPYQLLLSKGMWCLWSYDLDRDNYRIFDLSRMINVDILQEQFVFTQDYDYRKKSNGVFGAFYNDEEYDFTIRFWGEAAATVKDREWGKNQVQKDIGDEYGGIEISFTGCQYYEIWKWVMGFGSECIPLAPKKLVDQWKDEIRKMSEYLKE